MFTVTDMLLHRPAFSGASIHICTVCVAVGVGVGDGVLDGVAVGVGVGELVDVAVGVALGVAVAVGVGELVDVAVGVTLGVGVALAVAVGVGLDVLVGVGDGLLDGVAVGVGLAVAVAVGVGDGVGQITSTQSPLHVLFISFESLSYTTCSPLKSTLVFPQLSHDTLKLITASVPTPDRPPNPPTLFMIRTTPCIPAGMNPQSLTGTAFPPMSPSNTPVTCMMSGSYVTS